MVSFGGKCVETGEGLETGECLDTGGRLETGDCLEREDEAAAARSGGVARDFRKPARDVSSRQRAKRFKKGAQEHICNNENMHPRSRHRGVFVDYVDFAKKYPYLEPYVRSAKFGRSNINFRDPRALYYLSKAFLKEFYNLEFQMPVDEEHRFLIPCVPSRANYLHHIADLLVDVDVEATAYLKGQIPGHSHLNFRGSNNGRGAWCEAVNGGDVSDNTTSNTSRGMPAVSADRPAGTTRIPSASSTSDSSHGDAASPLQGDRVVVLDIGVGANCIYPLLGVREYGWRFVGSDVSEASLAVAKQNVQMNAMESKISLRLQPSRENYFVNIINREEFYCLTMCNPPFHSSREEVNVCPVRTLEAQDHEIICEGGEAQFIANLIEESRAVCAQVLWFTTLVARATTVKEIKKRLWEELRNFSHEKVQQEALMGQLWQEHTSQADVTKCHCSGKTASHVTGTNCRDSGETGAEDVAGGDVQTAAGCTDAGRRPVAPFAGGKLTKPGEEETEGACEGTSEGFKENTTGKAQGETPAGSQNVPGTKGDPDSLSSNKEQKREAKGRGDWRSLHRVHVCEFRVKELLQGKQTRWALCWTYWTPEQRKIVRRNIGGGPVQE